MAMVIRRPRFGATPPHTDEVSAFHMPGESWTLGAGQGCAPGYTEQMLPDGTWTCISAADFRQVQAGNFDPLVPIGAAPAGPVIFTPPTTPSNPVPVPVVWTPPAAAAPTLAPPTVQAPSGNLLPPQGFILAPPPGPDGGAAVSGGDAMPQVVPTGNGGPGFTPAPTDTGTAFPSTVVFGGLALLAAAVLLSRKR